MNFRYARHTNNLKSIVDFYTKIIGLEILGNFKNHAN
jgi:catechol-2,3-dioxygenase